MDPAIRPTYAFNKTRQTVIASELSIADTHWTRLKGLIGVGAKRFLPGHGLWIVPCHGVHTMAMAFTIDIVYLNEHKTVVHVEENVKPWRVTPIRMDAATVIEVPNRTVGRTFTEVGDDIEIRSFDDEVIPDSAHQVDQVSQ